MAKRKFGGVLTNAAKEATRRIKPVKRLVLSQVPAEPQAGLLPRGRRHAVDARVQPSLPFGDLFRRVSQYTAKLALGHCYYSR